MKLVIAEKPSVAQSLAAVIGATARKDGYLEGGGYLVSWCFGHLAELASAETYNEAYAKWRYDDLPILPEPWQMVVSKDKKKQFDVLKQLMNAPDVTEVVNACDAGREGELIFRAVYELAGCTKPMRLWISSMEDSAIREGFANLRPGADYDGLRDAALCRAKADWLVGINATRLFSVLYHRTLNIGRVMSPTLALIVQREAEIDTFKPVPFYTVTLELPERYLLGVDPAVYAVYTIHGRDVQETASVRVPAAVTGLEELLATFSRGKLLKLGVPTVILGRPNVGKSSLLNALLGYDRAIVTDVAGTTRDTVEEKVRVGHVLLRLCDTAGIHQTEDAVEKIGVERARAAARQASLALLVLDGSTPLTDADREAMDLARQAPNLLVAVNKSDLPRAVDIDRLADEFDNVVSLSARSGEGVSVLCAAIGAMYPAGEGRPGELLTNARQADAVSRALASVRSARSGE